MSDEQLTQQKLTRERPTKGAFTEFDFANVQFMLFAISPIVMVVGAVLLSVLGIAEETRQLGMLYLGVAYAVTLGSAGMLGMYFDWHKKGVGIGKAITKQFLRFLKPNSDEALLTVERTIVVSHIEEIEARDPVEALTKVLTTDTEIQKRTAKKIVTQLMGKLPKITNGETPYKLVRWYFPDTPFPDPVEVKRDQWELGGKGTPLNRSLLVLTHPDYTRPGEIFDLTDKTTTLFANYESDTIAYLGSLDIWEFVESLGEWIATPGLVRQYRHTWEAVKPTDPVREFVQIVELLRAYQNVAGSEMRQRNLSSALTRSLEEGFFKSALGDGLAAAAGGFQRPSMWGKISEHKWEIIIIGALCILFAAIFLWPVVFPVGP